jgi:uncharacterized membrane protein
MTLLFAFLIGVGAGLRTFTPAALAAWAVYLGWLNPGRPLALIGSLPAVIILSLFAAAELYFDKLPDTPNRTAPLGLIARLVSGGVIGACISLSRAQGAPKGAVLGAVGGAVGCFAGYYLRTKIVRTLKTQDIYVATVEDLVAIAGCLWIVSHLSS